MKRTRKPEVVSITGARSGLSEDVNGRTRRYLVSMGIRTVCFVAAVLAHGPLRWGLVAAALVLPYVAVVVANAGRESAAPDGPAPVTPEQAPGLAPGQEPPAAP